MSRGITLTTTWTMQLVVACGLFGAAQAAAHGQGFGLAAKPKKDDPQTAIAHSAGLLRAAFPSLSELEQGGVRMKPESYKGLSVESQPLRVVRNDEKDVGTIILGSDDLGSTELRFAFDRGEFKSLAGVPGTEWILSPNKLVTAGDIQVRGLRLRVLVRQYEWRDPAADKRELIDNVVHIEAENIDDARPGELLYSSEGKQGPRFVLSEKRGLFIVTNYASNAAHLIEARGWRKVDRGRDEPTASSQVAPAQKTEHGPQDRPVPESVAPPAEAPDSQDTGAERAEKPTPSTQSVATTSATASAPLVHGQTVFVRVKETETSARETMNPKGSQIKLRFGDRVTLIRTDEATHLYLVGKDDVEVWIACTHVTPNEKEIDFLRRIDCIPVSTSFVFEDANGWIMVQGVVVMGVRFNSQGQGTVVGSSSSMVARQGNAVFVDRRVAERSPAVIEFADGEKSHTLRSTFMYYCVEVMDTGIGRFQCIDLERLVVEK